MALIQIQYFYLSKSSEGICYDELVNNPTLFMFVNIANIIYISDIKSMSSGHNPPKNYGIIYLTGGISLYIRGDVYSRLYTSLFHDMIFP